MDFAIGERGCWVPNFAEASLEKLGAWCRLERPLDHETVE